MEQKKPINLWLRMAKRGFAFVNPNYKLGSSKIKELGR